MHHFPRYSIGSRKGTVVPVAGTLPRQSQAPKTTIWSPLEATIEFMSNNWRYFLGCERRVVHSKVDKQQRYLVALLLLKCRRAPGLALPFLRTRLSV
jgi:hypothetical protein